MATSGTIQEDIRTGYRLQIAWTVDSQSVANNTSTVTAKVQLVSTGSSYTINSSVSKSGSLTINGTKYSFTFTAALSGSQTKTLFTKTVTVAHSADGTKTCSFSASCGINVTLSGTYYGAVPVSGSGTFNTIARASTISGVTSSVSVTGSNSVTVNITRASSSFTHTVVFSIGSYSYTASSVATSTSYAIPQTWLNAIPNATSGTARVTVTTYSSGTKVGSAVSKNFTITVPATVVPTFSSVAVADTTTYQGTFGNMVQNKSKAKLTITAAGAFGSTIKTYKTVFEGKSYSGATPTMATITKSGTASASITITDSRGRTATYEKTWTVVAYASPKIINFQGTRCLADGTENYEGTYLKTAVNFSISPVNNKNGNSYTIEYKPTTGTTWTKLTEGTAYSMNQTIISSTGFMTTENSYDVKLTVKDSFTTLTRSFEVSTAFTLLDFNASGRGMAFGKVSEMASALEFGMPVHFDRAPIINGGSKMLWTGSWYMTAAHVANLSEKITDQMSGVVLVFSRYENGAVVDNNFQFFFVPKAFINLLKGYGCSFVLAANKFGAVATKYLYINDTYITGHVDNNVSGTVNGITFNNAAFVMRYVIGV